MGRKSLMVLSGLPFVVSIPVIALAQGYSPLVLGRLLQGISAGLIGVVVPLYLAECLSAANRGKGTAMFQWLLTLGIVSAALVGHLLQLSVSTKWRNSAIQQNYSYLKTTPGAASSGCPCRRHPVCDRELSRGRVAALAVPPRQKRSRADAALAAFAHPEQARLGTARDGGNLVRGGAKAPLGGKIKRIPACVANT